MIDKIIKSSLFKDTGIYTLTSILNSAIPFLLLPILTRYLTPEAYGMISMFSLLCSFVAPFVGVGVNNAITIKYYDQENIDIRHYIFNCILILISSTLIVGLLFWLFAEPIALVSSFPVRFLWLVVVYSFSQFITSILLTLWQVQKKAFLYGIFNNVKTLVDFGLSTLFIIGFKYGWQGRIYGQFGATVFFAILATHTLVKNEWIEVSFNKNYIRSALMFGIPLIPHALSGSIISMTDRFFITNMVGLSATGVYTVGYQIGSIINLLAVSFNNAYAPWLYERLKKDNYVTNLKIVKFSYLYFIGITFLALIFGVLAPPVLTVFLGKTFNESSLYVIWIAMGYAFNGMYFMVVNYIFYEQKTKLLATVTFATAILNIILNYVFIKQFGAIGAAQATAIVFAIKFVVIWLLSARVHEMPWNLKKKTHEQ